MTMSATVSGRSLRGRSTDGSTTKNRRSKSISSRSKIHPYRVSRARKALNFDNEVVTKRKVLPTSASTGPLDELTRFPSGSHDEHSEASRELVTSRNNEFWCNPPPAGRSLFRPLGFTTFPVTASATLKHRRSQRLILKGHLTDELQAQNESDADSGIEPTPPSSGTFSVPVAEGLKKPSFDSISIHSDYGTSSENSFSSLSLSSQNQGKLENRIASNLRGMNKRKVTNHSSNSSICNVSSRPDMSPGYVSDIDEIHSPDGLRRAEPWCLDDEFGREDQDVLLVIDQSGTVGLVEESGSFLHISNLRTNGKVTWVRQNGLQIVIPMEGYKLPSGYEDSSEVTGSFSPEDLQSPSPLSRLRRRVSRRRRRILPPPTLPPSPFSIRTTDKISSLQDSFLRYGLRVIGASEVISLEPLGTTFCELYPAIVSIPLSQIPSPGDEIYCLYTNGKVSFDDGPNPLTDPCLTWHVLHHTKFTLEGGRLTFETNEFNSFVVMIKEFGIEAHKQIRTRIGGRLYVPEVPWIEIYFPKGCVREDITAKAHVFLDTEMSLPDFIKRRAYGQSEPPVALASPIVMLEPHGYDFSPDFVTIQLPIPNYDEIVNLFGPAALLVIWQSRTGNGENKQPTWEVLNVPYTLRKLKHLGNSTQTVISFRVSHFSFFRVVWDLISASLYEARVGMSYFHSFVSFSMKCQANMEEANDNRFGLEITCYRSDKRFPELTNYHYIVGASSKPKLVRPGKIYVRLKSSYFEADEDAGEDPELVKAENDFRGRDFEVQYCCKFKPEKPVDRGPFGKVIVNRQHAGKQEEKLFEFNLQKSGHEGEKTPSADFDRWSIVALQELASSLFVTDGENWKLFASQIGFTKQEIKQHFKKSPNPFTAMVTMYQHRGGTPDEFVAALYSVNRRLKISGGVSPPLSSRQSSSSTHSSGIGSMGLADLEKHRNIGSDSDTSGTQVSQDSLLAVLSRKRPNSSVNRSNDSSSKKRRKPSPELDAADGDKDSSTDSCKHSESKEVGREISTQLMDNSNADDKTSSIQQRNDLTKLESSFLWEISSHMDGLSWKSLGRTLRLEEAMLLNIETNHRNGGIRELFYQMLLHWKEKYPKQCTFGILYGALRKEGMNAVAKAMMTIRRND